MNESYFEVPICKVFTVENDLIVSNRTIGLTNAIFIFQPDLSGFPPQAVISHAIYRVVCLFN